jgi:hypothetical protein
VPFHELMAREVVFDSVVKTMLFIGVTKGTTIGV